MLEDNYIPRNKNFILTSNAEIPDALYSCVQFPTDFEIIKTDKLTIKIEIPKQELEDLSEIVPCFSSLQKYSYRASLSGKGLNGEDVFAALDGIGGSFPEVTQIGDSVVADTDTFIIKKQCTFLILQFEVFADPIIPWIVSFSLRSKSKAALINSNSIPKIEPLNVPALSQFDIPEIGSRICSPTSTAMLLKYFGRECSAKQVADLAYLPSADLYGVWPAAIYAANQFGLMGTLVRFDSLAFCELLKAKIPFAASIRYGKNELTGAAIEHNTVSGHLIVVTGINNNRIFVSDPAAKSPSEVQRSYNIDEFLKIWLSRSAIAYVFFHSVAILPEG